MNKEERRKAMLEAIGEEWERAAMPHPRDILKEEYNRSLTRPRDIAMEKWGPMIEEMIEDDLSRGIRGRSLSLRMREVLGEREPTEKSEPEWDKE